MFFQENKLNEFSISYLAQHFESIKPNRHIYGFKCFNNELPAYDFNIIIKTNADNYYSNRAEVKLRFMIDQTDEQLFEESRKQIINYFSRLKILKFFFDNPRDVKKKRKTNSVSLEDYNGKGEFYNFTFTLIGQLKFNINKDFHLLYFLDVVPDIHELTNEKTNEFIKNHYEQINEKKEVFKELMLQFDINSEDLYNALKLQFSY